MTGFASKRAMSQGYYIPGKNLPWRDRIYSTYLRAVSRYGNDRWDDIISDCMDFMQREYPGHYSSLKWVNGGLEPVFDEPKYETLWKIHYE